MKKIDKFPVEGNEALLRGSTIRKAAGNPGAQRRIIRISSALDPITYGTSLIRAVKQLLRTAIPESELVQINISTNTFDENLEDSRHLMELFLLILNYPKLVISQVEGHAIAGGCGLASVCDVIFSIPEAKFGYTEVKIGFIPALVSCFLIRKLGEGRAKELLLSGELIDAQTASSYGLINFIASKEEIESAVHSYAKKIVEGTSSNSITVTKQLLTTVQDLNLDESLNLAIGLNVQTRSSADCKKGITAFLNKNKLEW
jgi:methylglutaconyl-CoA hydratase